MIEHSIGKKKFSAYVDESGQDTEESLFVVSVFITKNEGLALAGELERIEKESGKRNVKWHKAKYAFRKGYIERIIQLREMKRKLFFDTFQNSQEYIELTSLATAKAVLKKAGDSEYSVSIFVDGLKKKEIEVFSRVLRSLRVKTRKIRGVKKDENSVFIRLVDAVCGLIRDARDGDEWATKALNRMLQEKIVTEM
jgi:hypothetical protein